MATKCFQSIQGLCIRVTKLDNCCTPPSSGTPGAFVVSDSFIDLTLTAELEEPDEFTLKLANGKLCINEVGCATLKRYTVEVNLCNADPDLFSLIGGVSKVLDFNGDVVGYEIDENLGECGKFALEFWTRVPADQCLDPTGLSQYVYWLIPCLQNGRVGDITIENGPLQFSFTADSVPTHAWQQGPFDVVAQDGANTAGPLLAPLGCKTALHTQLTTIAPPCSSVPSCATSSVQDADCGAKVMP